MNGTLYLIPNTLGEGDESALELVLPAPVRARAASLHYYIGENAKTTRAFLKKVGTERPIQEIEIRELNVNTPAGEIDKLVAPLLSGKASRFTATCPSTPPNAPNVCAISSNSRARADKRRSSSKRRTGIAHCSIHCSRPARHPRSSAWRSI
jgi:16S rRNA C1402 (ribose-2'-O) methylase RsmI